MNLYRKFIAASLIFFALAAGAAENTAKLDENGLHIQNWFHQSSGNLLTDLQAAEAQGKGLVILYEQRGCVYCAELHAVNFARPEIVDLIDEGFLVVQLDLNSRDEIFDLDGTILSESSLAQKWGVTFTPTTLVFSGSDTTVQSREDAEIFRLPGYIPPFYYYTALDYFASGEYTNKDFQAFLRIRVSELNDQGIDPEFW